MKSEHAIQSHIVTLLRKQGLFTIDCDVMSALRYLPERDKRRILFIGQHKGLGYTKGQPDLIVVLPNGGVLFVELKNGKIGRQSVEQKRVQAKLTSFGHTYLVWRCEEDAINWLKELKQCA